MFSLPDEVATHVEWLKASGLLVTEIHPDIKHLLICIFIKRDQISSRLFLPTVAVIRENVKLNRADRTRQEVRHRISINHFLSTVKIKQPVQPPDRISATNRNKTDKDSIYLRSYWPTIEAQKSEKKTKSTKFEQVNKIGLFSCAATPVSTVA